MKHRTSSQSSLAQRYLDNLKAVNTDPVIAKRIETLEKSSKSSSATHGTKQK